MGTTITEVTWPMKAGTTTTRDVNPLGDQIKGAGAAHVAPHVNLSGDAVRQWAGNPGTGAYTARMQSLHDRVAKLGEELGLQRADHDVLRRGPPHPADRGAADDRR